MAYIFLFLMTYFLADLLVFLPVFITQQLRALYAIRCEQPMVRILQQKARCRVGAENDVVAFLWTHLCYTRTLDVPRPVLTAALVMLLFAWYC
jgi:hypothetical protein